MRFDGRPLLLVLCLALPATADDAGSFRDAVAPILQARCVRCHGGTSTKGGLSLATVEGITKGGDSGPPVEPGKPDESYLVDVVTGDEPLMPKGGEPLSADEVAALRRWIAAGAHWPEGLALKETKDEGPWWAIRPLNPPAIPAVSDPSWCRSPLDAFILAKLDAKGLRPRAEADRRTLIRRLTYDLHGRPPMPAEIDAFVGDPAGDAYERLVDRLLASPRYGERWARHWLDVVHYGDTHGYDKDKRRDHAWPYRDYVIRSLNEDKPYSRFVREQLAGEVRYPDDPQATIATGFVAAGPWDFVGHVELREGTVDKLKTRLLDRDDMLANAMSTFVSLTVHCARCHDHKFDPIPQRDYYRLQAVFAGVDRGDRPYASPRAAAARVELERKRAEAAGRLAAIDREIAELTSPELARIDEELATLRREFAALPPLPDTPASPTNGYHSAIHPTAEADAWVQVDLGTSVAIDEIRLVPARPTDFPDTPGFGFPARYKVLLSDEPTFARATVVQEGDDDAPHDDEADVIRPGGASARYVRVQASRLWKRTGDYVFALAELEVISAGVNRAAGAAITSLDSIEGGRWGRAALVDGFTSRARRPADLARRSDLRFRFQQAGRERRRLADALIGPELQQRRVAARAAVAALDEQIRRQPPTEAVYALNSHDPRPIHVLNRGDVEQPGEEVGPGALTCVPGLSADFDAGTLAGEGDRRAALADWIVDPHNVLTWRSIVNRIWHYHFGRGLVDTPGDFGRNGGTPTHPELLDWLAVRFRDGGGSWKDLHRLIVCSATYRQSSTGDEAAAKVDGDNRLLWRQNRRRLEAEAVRDAVLSVAGTLDDRMGGPAFEPFRFKDDHSPIYDHEAIDRINAPECRRRTIYRFVVRSVPNPFVECLDGADPNANTPVRNATITALQALTLLNDPFMLAQAEALARRLEGEAGGLHAQFDRAFVLALGRGPTDTERRAIAAYAGRRGLPAACRLLFNLNEFMFVD